MRSGVSKALEREGSKPAGRNESERSSLDIFSAERCSRGPNRSCHGEGNRQHSETGWDAGPLRGLERGTLGKNRTEQERPSPAALSGNDRAYKAGRLKTYGAGRESEGFVVPGKPIG